MADALNSRSFYATWSGHEPRSLIALITHLRRNALDAPLLFLCGDSSLDNKAWVDEQRDAAPQVCGLLSPPASRPDVAHALNVALAVARDAAAPAHDALQPIYAAVNGAVEETTLAARSSGLLPQDEVVARALTPQDVLCVSIGGNDIILAPSCAAVSAVAALLMASPSSLEDGSAMGLPHLVALFKDATEAYLERLCEHCTPAAIVVCSPYFPAQSGRGWADTALSLMGYNCAPSRLQRAIRAVHKHATSQVRGPRGTRVIPLALGDVLDASDPAARDYVARVEPSEEGGRKMADAILAALTRRGTT